MEYYLNEKDFNNLYIRIKMMHYIYTHMHYYRIRPETNIILFNLFINRNKKFAGDIIIYFYYNNRMITQFKFMDRFADINPQPFIFNIFRLNKARKIFIYQDDSAKDIIKFVESYYNNNGINDFVANYIINKTNKNEFTDYKLFNHMSILELISFYRFIIKDNVIISPTLIKINETKNDKKIEFNNLSYIERLFCIETNKYYNNNNNPSLKIRLNNDTFMILSSDKQD